MVKNLKRFEKALGFRSHKPLIRLFPRAQDRKPGESPSGASKGNQAPSSEMSPKSEAMRVRRPTCATQ
jgi:hypothetical protein